LLALTSRLKIDQFINITEIENKRVELISSSGQVGRELENKRTRKHKNERGTSTRVDLNAYVRGIEYGYLMYLLLLYVKSYYWPSFTLLLVFIAFEPLYNKQPLATYLALYWIYPSNVPSRGYLITRQQGIPCGEPLEIIYGTTFVLTNKRSGLFDHSNELSGSIKGGQFLEYLSDY
jgi:hypothetical protein